MVVVGGVRARLRFSRGYLVMCMLAAIFLLEDYLTGWLDLNSSQSWRWLSGWTFGVLAGSLLWSLYTLLLWKPKDQETLDLKGKILPAMVGVLALNALLVWALQFEAIVFYLVIILETIGVFAIYSFLNGVILLATLPRMRHRSGVMRYALFLGLGAFLFILLLFLQAKVEI